MAIPTRSPLVPLLALLCAASCGGPEALAPKAKTPASSAKGKPAPPIAMVSPSRLVPDVLGDRGLVSAEEGTTRLLVDRMRILARDDGTLERATELFPPGDVHSVSLPSRLGGGFLFFAVSAGGTQIWRARGFLDPLVPLVQIGSIAEDVIAGFDRLYIRLSTNNRLLAVDAETGEPVGLSPLPPSTSYGPLAFADGWRAVVVTDLEGPLATFDAGATWRPVGVEDAVLDVRVSDGDPAVFVRGGAYSVDGRGLVTFRPDESPSSHPMQMMASGLPRPVLPSRPSRPHAKKISDGDEGPGDPMDEGPVLRKAGPLGRRPLRAAVEDGFPDSNATAVVARRGALHRVALSDGAIVASREGAYPDAEAKCHAILVGEGYGFLCGETDGPTSIYAFSAPLSLTPVLRFERPRFVSASGNGALVIRGGCGDGPRALDDTRPYCIVSKDGNPREIRVRGRSGDGGVERVIALADGRVAVMIPPRYEAAGQLTVLAGDAATSYPLSLPSKPSNLSRALTQGMWLDGFEERTPGVLRGWVEAGGPVVGVAIALDGKVTAGDLRGDAASAIVSGRFGLAMNESGSAAESSDGGQTWSDLDLPDIDEDPAAYRSRACGPVGCSLSGWVRVGWGEPKTGDDLKEAASPKPLYAPIRVSQTLHLGCTIEGESTPPLPPRPETKVAAPVLVKRHLGRVSTAPSDEPVRGPWLPFRNTEAPPLGTDEIGFDNGARYDSVPMRAYAWGQRGADWSRAGRWMIRFDDPFDPSGGVRSTAPSVSPWLDEGAAADAMGIGTRGATWAWSAGLDPEGHAALVSACRGGACALFAAAEGHSILSVRDTSGRIDGFRSPLPDGAVRLGEAWFFLTSESTTEGSTIALHRVDLGVGRTIAVYRRATRLATIPAPKLVRRASGTGLGLLFAASLDAGVRPERGSFYVLPIDPESGALRDAVLLGQKDLSERSVARCDGRRDGWLLNTSMDIEPVIALDAGRASFDVVNVKLRLDPGFACIEGASARIDGVLTRTKAPPNAPKAPDAKGSEAIPLAATERVTGRRWSLACEVRER